MKTEYLRDGDLRAAARRLGLPCGRPVLVLVGGAEGMTPDSQDTARRTVREVVLPVVEALGAVIVDGGTDSGIMRVIGTAVAEAGWSGPVVGVAVENMVSPPGEEPSGRVPLEPHHTHALLVPGKDWGDESHVIAGLASTMAGDAPSATLLVNGGRIGRSDVDHSRRRDRVVVVLRGSGRLADELADSDADVTVLDPDVPLEQQRALLRGVLTRPVR